MAYYMEKINFILVVNNSQRKSQSVSVWEWKFENIEFSGLFHIEFLKGYDDVNLIDILFVVSAY